MCGIAGILTNQPDYSVLERRIHWIQETLLHRGPDDKGIYISQDQDVALTHTRLAILDLSPAGHQPMCSADARYWITFNGEIYNFRELRSRLERQGETFHSQSDTEVILKLYQQMGANCVTQLRGMFAFCIWDEQEKTGFLARDPLGIKPLYYWHSDSTLVFASELRAVLASQYPSIQLSMSGLYGYLASGSVPEPHTLIDEIYCLPAGHFLHWQMGTFTLKKYWDIHFENKPISFPEAKKKVRSALIDSIQHHFISDVPVGIFLSGGIDSTAIVALSRQTQTNVLQTYSIGFEEMQWNEGDVAQNIARQFETQHTAITMTKSLAQKLFPKYLSAIDQPSVDGFNTFCVSQIAHQNGSKVVLSGLGGDEFFGGYHSFQQIPIILKLGKTLHALRPVNIAVGKSMEQWGASARIKRLGDFLQHAPTFGASYDAFRGIFSHQEICKIIHQYLPEQDLPSRQTSSPSNSLPSIEDEVSRLEISRYMRNQLLRDSDVMSMAWGLELRVPFVDRQLLEEISSIPSSMRLLKGKQLLVEAVPEIPDFVVNRPKQGFIFPFEQWLKQDWQNLFSNVQCPDSISLSPWARSWSLAILQHWWQSIQP